MRRSGSGSCAQTDMFNPDKKTQLRLSSSAGIFLLAAIAVALNIVSHFAHFRLDLSKGSVYSISGASVKMLRELPDPVVVKVYYSRDLPPQVSVARNYLRDLLTEYSSSSKGKLRFSFIETDESRASRDEALSNGIVPVRFDIFSKEKFEQREGFLGLTLQFRDKKDAIAFLGDTAGLEYELTSRIKTLAAREKQVLGFVSGYGALGPEELEEGLAGRLQLLYEIRKIDFEAIPADSGIPAGIQTLFFLGPDRRISDKGLYLLDRYLLSGRSLCLAIDTKKADMRSFSARDNDTGLLPFLAAHGLQVRPVLVMDAQSQPIQISARQGDFVVSNIVKYPPFVVSGDLNQEHPLTKGLDSLVLPFSSPVDISSAASSARTDVLARSSPRSWAGASGSGYENLNPFRQEDISEKDSKGPFVLAAALQDKFRPYFPKPPEGVKTGAPLPGQSKTGRIVLITTSAFLRKEYRMPESNYHFFLNMADWLSQDDELIAIRSKSVRFHPLREIPAPLKTVIRYVNMLLPPLIAAAVGLIFWKLRGKRRAAAARAYGKNAA